jgi:hypothetical protein
MLERIKIPKHLTATIRELVNYSKDVKSHEGFDTGLHCCPDGSYSLVCRWERNWKTQAVETTTKIMQDNITGFLAAKGKSLDPKIVEDLHYLHRALTDRRTHLEANGVKLYDTPVSVVPPQPNSNGDLFFLKPSFVDGDIKHYGFYHENLVRDPGENAKIEQLEMNFDDM